MFWLPGRGRVELRLGDLVPAPLVAALVEADGGPVAVEHRVTGPHGVDVGPCASASAPVWHLASGATTRDAREVLVLFNPFPTDAIVDITFDTDAGSREPVRFQGFPVAAGTVVGVDIGDDVARESQVSATLRTRAPAGSSPNACRSSTAAWAPRASPWRWACPKRRRPGRSPTERSTTAIPSESSSTTRAANTRRSRYGYCPRPTDRSRRRNRSA